MMAPKARTRPRPTRPGKKKAKVGSSRYVTYLTRKLDARLHRELHRLADNERITVQDMLNVCLHIGVEYMLRTRGLKALSHRIESGIDWTQVEDGTGESEYASR